MPRKGPYRELFPYERDEDFAHWAWVKRAVVPVLSGEEALRELERLEKEARAGHPRAIVRYVRHLLKNPEEPRRYQRVRRLLGPALEQNDPEALHIAGLMAVRGDGVSPDEEKGLSLIERAAYAGRVEAMLDAARLYETVRIDPKKALYWWRLAAAHGVVSAECRVGEIQLQSARSPEELASTRLLLEHAARAHDPRAALLLSKLLARRGPLQDEETSHYWLKESALGGDPEAQFRLGIAHWAGRLGVANQREAIRWIARAAEAGHSGAVEMLANLFLSGSNVPMNRVYGCALLRTAKKLGDPQAGSLLKSLTPLLRRSEYLAVGKLVREYPDIAHLVERLLPRKTR